jgi:hypothetical protein
VDSVEEEEEGEDLVVSAEAVSAEVALVGAGN